MNGVPATSAVAASQLPPSPAFAGHLSEALAARMTFQSAEAVGKFSKASARATASFREFLARKLGGSAEEGEFSAALIADGAVVAGSAVLSGGLIRDCAWAAGDLDVWAPAVWESERRKGSYGTICGTIRKRPFRSVAAFLDKNWGSATPPAALVTLAGAKRSASTAGLAGEPAATEEVTAEDLPRMSEYALAFEGWDGPVPSESSMVHAVTVRANLKAAAVPAEPAMPGAPGTPPAPFDAQLIESAFPHAAVRRRGPGQGRGRADSPPAPPHPPPLCRPSLQALTFPAAWPRTTASPSTPSPPTSTPRASCATRAARASTASASQARATGSSCARAAA